MASCYAPLGVLILLTVAARSSVSAGNDEEFSCSSSLACQNLKKACHDEMNRQIRAELNASYTYMSMGTHFLHDQLALKGFSKFFFKASGEEREHALKMIEYLTERGGHVKFYALDPPPMRKWDTGLAALQSALSLEKEVNSQLLQLHTTCEGDPTMQDFLESNFLNEQVDSIKQLADHVTRLKRLHQHSGSAALGEYMYDKDM